MNLDNLDEYFGSLFDRATEWIDHQAWRIEDWWHAGKYGPPNIWYHLQTFIDPPPPASSAKPDEGVVSFALKHLTKKQINREAWYYYRKTKWIVRPESMFYIMRGMKTKKDKKYMSMLLQLEELVLDNYKALLAEVEIRRVYSSEELDKSKSNSVLRAQVRQTYDAYIESL